MANSSKRIVRGVRFNGKTYAAGMEDELAKVLPSTESDRLLARGHLEGSWSGAAPPAAEKPPEVLKDPVKESRPAATSKQPKEKE